MVGDDTLFAKLAVRIGALAPDEVARVRGEHDPASTSLEQALLERGMLEPELASLVRAACETARDEDWFPPRRSA